MKPKPPTFELTSLESGDYERKIKGKSKGRKSRLRYGEHVHHSGLWGES